MDIQPQSTQPISDDQELAKVLAGVSNTDNTSTVPEVDTTMPVPAGPPPAAPVADDASAAMPLGADSSAEPELPPMPTTPALGFDSPAPTAVSGELDGVKQDAINELRPLVDKLNLAPEEKFDTYLLLIRSTDDKALVAPAHEAAKQITDEARRAQALLDIIKEIDFLSGAQPQA